jgi:hypothetical protein
MNSILLQLAFIIFMDNIKTTIDKWAEDLIIL